jgi:hypothetical protein
MVERRKVNFIKPWHAKGDGYIHWSEPKSRTNSYDNQSNQNPKQKRPLFLGNRKFEESQMWGFFLYMLFQKWFA